MTPGQKKNPVSLSIHMTPGHKKKSCFSVFSQDSLINKLKLLETELNTLKTAKAASDQLAYNVVKQAEQQGVEVGEEETQMRETVSN